MSLLRTSLAILFVTLALPSQTLVKDINAPTNPSSDPSAGIAISSPSFVGFLFTADDASHGRELWRTDATSGGTVMVTDLWPGLSGSAPRDFAQFGNYVYFSADDGVHGRELWRSDGTAVGTTLVADIVLGAQGSDPGGLAATSTRLYFSADTPAYGRELWSTTGTNASQIVDLNPGPTSGYVDGLIASTSGLERVMYFGNDGLKGVEPVICFGTTTTAYDLQPFGSSNPEQPVSWNGDFYCVATTSPTGTQVWRIDLGIQKALEVSAVSQGASTQIFRLTAGSSHVYFASYPQFTAPLTVYRCDGTSSVPLNSHSGPVGVGPSYFHGEFSGFFYYTVGVYQGGAPVPSTYAVQVSSGLTTKLDRNPLGPMMQAGATGAAVFIAWSTVGGGLLGLYTVSGSVTTMVRVFPYFAAPGQPSLLGTTKYHAYLSVYDPATGTEPWVSNFTAAGTGLLKELALPSVGSSFPTSMVAYRDALYFAANDGRHGEELWRSDGTEAGTQMVRDINAVGGNGSNPQSFFVFQNILYFQASVGFDGAELWRSDGTNAGTYRVRDINPGVNSSAPGNFFELKQKLFFTADDGIHGREFWCTDGSSAGTVLFHDLVAGSWSGTGGAYFDVVSTGTVAFFVGDDGAHGAELWLTDGTVAGTRLIKDIFPGLGSAVRSRLTLSGSNVYFAARDLNYGYELWRSDGTAGGTFMVKDINPGSGDGDPLDILAGYQQGVYFAATDPTTGTELWRSDGTYGGTYQVANLAPGPISSFPKPLVVTMEGARETLLFSASNPTSQLYSATPQGAGTVALKPLAVNAARQAGLGRLIVFAGDDGVSGSELWVSDASVVGTTRVADLEPGFAGSLPAEFTPVGAKLFFSASNSITGRELYVLPLKDVGAALYEPFGVGCANTGGVTPILSLGSTRPSLREGSYVLMVTNARANAPATMFYAAQSMDTPLGLGCHLYVPLGAPSFAFTTSVGGIGLLPIPIPNVPWIIGNEAYWQAAILDPTGLFLSLVTITSAGKVTVGK